jgi:ABC-2 type transport system permease protein
MILRAFFRQGNQVFWNYGFFLLLQVVACSVLAANGADQAQGRAAAEARDLKPLLGCAVLTLSLLAGGIYGTTYGLWNFFRGGVIERYWRSRSRFSTIAAFLLARFLVLFTSGLIQVALLYYVYGVGRGRISFGVLAASLALADVTFVVLGLAAVMVSRDHFRSYFVSNLLFALLVVFSGAVRPLEALPGWAKAAGEALPASHAMEAIQQSLAQSAAWDHVAVSFGMMGLWTVLFVALTAFTFNWLVFERAR